MDCRSSDIMAFPQSCRFRIYFLTVGDTNNKLREWGGETGGGGLKESKLRKRILLKVVYPITHSWLIKKKKDFVGGVKNLEQLGFKVIHRRFVTQMPSTRKKVKQIHTAFLNRRAGIILAQRG